MPRRSLRRVSQSPFASLLFAFTISSGLPLFPSGAAHAALPGRNGQIAFASERDGDMEIYTMHRDGTSIQQLTDNTASDRGPAWSPDGKAIAFLSDRTGDNEIYWMHANGTGQTRLTFDPGDDENPTWSPDGSKIAFISNRDGDYEIYVMNSDGSGVTQLTFNALVDIRPAWSPDGSRIAFARGTDFGSSLEIWIMNADGTDATQLTFNGYQEAQVEWSPDGSKILFRREYPLGSGWAELLTMNPNGTGETNVTNTASVYEGEGDFSPDGASIVFNSNESDASFDIYVMNADGSGRRRLTNSSGQDSDLDWQPMTPSCFHHVSENFSDTILSPVWLLTTTGACSLPAFGNGELRMAVDDACSAASSVAQDLILDKNVAKLCGDFDVSIDYTAVDFTTPASGFRVMGLEIDRASNDAPVGFIGRIAQPATACEPTGQFYIAWTDNSSCFTQHFAATSDASGAYRFARVGDVGHMYFRSGPSGPWVELFSSTVTTEDLTLAVFAGSNGADHQAHDVRFDNLEVDCSEVTAAPSPRPVPASFGLTAWPRPLRAGQPLHVAFDLPQAGEASLAIYDVLGRRVASRTEGPRAAGRTTVEWALPGLTSGVYLVRLNQGASVAGARLLVVN